MKLIKEQICLHTLGKGMYEFTNDVNAIVREQNVQDGLCHLFIQHTSASLIISENADPTAKIDLEQFIDRIAPENQNWHRHTLEGPDDSPSHMKSILTNVDLTIPIDNGTLSLGTWQGIYLFEHRHHPHNRKILVRINDFS